ncbi:MAG: hypothetical protein JXN61_01130 [Sedimentisphaerales bacterium]|nr:hypothetical protein [Sedimentisphaerales bacterium]
MAETAVKRYGILVVTLCCCAVFVCGCGDRRGQAEKTKFEIDKPYERGPLSVRVRIDKSKLTIAETLLLELEATVEPGYEARMPKVDAVLEHFGILDWDNLGDKLDKDNNVVSTYRYRLEPFLSGKYEIPALTFEFVDVNSPEAKTYSLSTEPIEVEVTSLLGEDRAKLAIEDIDDVVEMAREASFWWVWALAAACIAGAAVAWLLMRRKRAMELIRIFRPAHEIAYARLRALVKEDLLKGGRVKEFYERISNILRHYIEDRFDLRAPERTTEEFLSELARTELLGAGDKDGLGEFLTHCDLVKFAKHHPTTEQIQRTFDLVKKFIEKTKSDERKIDVTDRVKAEQTIEAEVA